MGRSSKVETRACERIERFDGLHVRPEVCSREARPYGLRDVTPCTEPVVNSLALNRITRNQRLPGGLSGQLGYLLRRIQGQETQTNVDA